MILGVLFSLFSIILSLFLANKIWRSKQKLPPGPMALPIIGHMHLLGPSLPDSFRKLSARYGPLFALKLGSFSCVIVSSPELVREILKTNEHAFCSRSKTIAMDQLTYSSSFAFGPYGSYWRFMRKLSTSELLSNRTLQKFLPIRSNELRQFLQLLHKKSSAGQSVNLIQELTKLTNNIICQMMWSTSCSDSNSQGDSAMKLVHEATELLGAFNISDFIWLFKNIDLQGVRKKVEDVNKRYDAFLEKLISDREVLRAKNKSGGGFHETMDFLDMVLDVLDDHSAEFKLTREHIKALFLDLVIAATGTTAITLEWALAELINNPRVLAKAREEINNVVGNRRLVQESDSLNLPYIYAILKETFRLHSPIPMLARKSIEDCEINGYIIPSDTLLFVNMWSIGRDSKYWKDPLKFQPERFLESNENGGVDHVDVRGQHFLLLPFGTGRRSCPGMSSALLELPVTLGAMIQCFDWKVMDPLGDVKMKDCDPVDMTERPGFTAPRLHDLVCVPVALHSNLLNH